MKENIQMEIKMTDNDISIVSQLNDRQLPSWDELPDLELYMDQVLSLVGRYLPGSDVKSLTASMVNNYVKQKVLPPPVNKRYTRNHIAALLMLCSLKSVMPIADIQQLFTMCDIQTDIRPLYDEFRKVYNQVNPAVAKQIIGLEQQGLNRFLWAALASQAAQSLASALLKTLE
jgi:hypothetical protein